MQKGEKKNKKRSVGRRSWGSACGGVSFPNKARKRNKKGSGSGCTQVVDEASQGYGDMGGGTCMGYIAGRLGGDTELSSRWATDGSTTLHALLQGLVFTRAWRRRCCWLGVTIVHRPKCL